MEENKRKVVKKAVIVLALILLMMVIGFFIIKYETEGEIQMPFKLTKIMVISTADGTLKDDSTISVTQCNDLYISIEKNPEYTTKSKINNIYIENIKVMAEPARGRVEFYRPSAEGTSVYVYNSDLLLDGSITYSGDSQTSLKNLTISNQGGTISFRTCVRDIGEIPVNAEENEKEIGYSNDGTLLEKAQVTVSEIRYNMGFDIIIELSDGKMYKGYVNISLPIEDVEKNGVKGVEQADVEKVVFKRIKIK